MDQQTKYKKFKKRLADCQPQGLRVVHRMEPDGSFTLYIAEFPDSWSTAQRQEFFELFLDTVDDQAREHDPSFKPIDPSKGFYAALEAFRKPPH
jgi:hypothetical protein